MVNTNEECYKVYRRGIRWTTGKIATTIVLFTMSIALMFFAIKPLFEMDYGIKSFANLLFVCFEGFYLFSFFAIRRTSQFVFWVVSFILLHAMTLIFLFYEDILI
jgi:hypothetical protein